MTQPFFPILACHGGLNIPPDVAVLILGWLLSLVLSIGSFGLILLGLKNKTLKLVHGGFFVLCVALAAFLFQYTSSQEHDFSRPLHPLVAILSYSIPMMVIGQFVVLLRTCLNLRREQRRQEKPQVVKL